ncbi:MAG TPA: hypothetical protein DCP68_06565 [Ruminococcus sp.]|nr:hypothetical protein [Ruminococcus sp.]
MRRKIKKNQTEEAQEMRSTVTEAVIPAAEPEMQITTVEGMECSPYADEIKWAITVSKQYGFRLESAIEYALGICCTKCDITAIKEYVRKWWDLITPPAAAVVS